MKTLKIGVTNRIYLDTAKTIDDVAISIISGNGVYVKDNEDADVEDFACDYDTDAGKYYYDLELASDTTPESYYIVWTASYSGINVELEDIYNPEDCVIQEKMSIDNLLVSPSYVLDHFLRGITEGEIAATYQRSYREAIRDEIKAATQQLQTAVEIYFQSQLIENERHDYDMASIYDKYWTNNLYHTPIQSVVKVSLKLNNSDVIQEVPSEWVQIGNAKQGMIKVMPFSSSQGLVFVYRVGIGIALLLNGVAYIPDFFSYDYYAGLDWDNLEVDEKRDIQNAIGRKVALNMLPNLDVHRGLSSQSLAADGVSKNISYTSSATYGEHSAAIEQYKFQELQWINLFKKRYLKRLNVG
jgi:uncharacterized protein (DUF433 family)